MKRFESIQSSCGQVDGKRLFFGRATLSAVSVVVTGRRWFTPFSRRVLLRDIASVTRRSDSTKSDIVFRLVDGTSWALAVSAPGLWRVEASQRLAAVHPPAPGGYDEIEVVPSPGPVEAAVEPGLVEAEVSEPVVVAAEIAEPELAEPILVEPEPVPDVFAFEASMGPEPAAAFAQDPPGEDFSWLTGDLPANWTWAPEPMNDLNSLYEFSVRDGESGDLRPASGPEVSLWAIWGGGPKVEPIVAPTYVLTEAYSAIDSFLEGQLDVGAIGKLVDEWMDSSEHGTDVPGADTPAIDTLPDDEFHVPVSGSELETLLSWESVPETRAMEEEVDAAAMKATSWMEGTSDPAPIGIPPDWRPIYLIVRGRRVPASWQPLTEIGSER